MSDPSPSGETARWFCTMPRNLGRCFGPNTAPGHHACGPTWDCPTCDGEGCEEGCGRRGGCDDAYSGPDSHKTCRSCRGWGRTETEPPPPVPSSDTPSDERRVCPVTKLRCSAPECVDGCGSVLATARWTIARHTYSPPSIERNGQPVAWIDEKYVDALWPLIVAANQPQPTPPPPPVGEERRPVDGGKRSQSEQWFVVHHNQIRSLRFGTFPIERLARASIAACTCGPHTLRHTVTTTYTASTTEEFVAAAADRGEG